MSPRGGRIRRLARSAPRPAMGGFVLVSALSGALMLVLVLVAVWSQLAADRVLAQQTGLQVRAVAQAQGALLSWMRQHLAVLDGSAVSADSMPDPAEALQSVPDHARLQLALSQPLVHGAVHCRMLAVWWPGQHGVTAFDPVSGGFAQLAADTRYALVDGCSEERRAVAQAQARLDQLAGVFERWFQARVQDDPRHRLDLDHFSTADGTAPLGLAGLPCIDEFTVLDSVPALRQVPGITASALGTPWGPAWPIEVRSPAADTQVAPYQLFLQLRTPWGQLLTAQAVQAGA